MFWDLRHGPQAKKSLFFLAIWLPDLNFSHGLDMKRRPPQQFSKVFGDGHPRTSEHQRKKLVGPRIFRKRHPKSPFFGVTSLDSETQKCLVFLGLKLSFSEGRPFSRLHDAAGVDSQGIGREDAGAYNWQQCFSMEDRCFHTIEWRQRWEGSHMLPDEKIASTVLPWKFVASSLEKKKMAATLFLGSSWLPST